MMNKSGISSKFTIEDIHKIREYNYEATKNMTFEERKAYYEANAKETQKRIEEIRERNKLGGEN